MQDAIKVKFGTLCFDADIGRFATATDAEIEDAVRGQYVDLLDKLRVLGVTDSYDGDYNEFSVIGVIPFEGEYFEVDWTCDRYDGIADRIRAVYEAKCRFLDLARG